MKPNEIKSKIFLDSGDEKETELVLQHLGFLDGQTTNPSLVSKNPNIIDIQNNPKKHLSKDDLLIQYKEIIEKIAVQIPSGDISIEVYVDENTSVHEIIKQAKEMNSWIKSPFIKIPITENGLEAASVLVKDGIKVNMTLCFTQEQAAAVYSATRGADEGQVFISPFEGRLDDIGVDGMDLLTNIQKLYKNSDGHVKVLGASIRDIHHFMYAIYVDLDAITVPGKYLVTWADQGMPLLSDDLLQDNEQIVENRYLHRGKNIKDLDQKDLQIDLDWGTYNINHPLTSSGLNKFASDWNSLITR